MFGVTTPCVTAVVERLEADYDCLVFHATGTGGQSMEKLVDSGLIAGVLDITTTEVADDLVGGVLLGRARPVRRRSRARACPTSARAARSTWSTSAPGTRCRSAFAAALLHATTRR